MVRSWGGLALRRRLLGLRPGELALLVGCHPMHIGLAEGSPPCVPPHIAVLRERLHQALARLEQAPIAPVVLLASGSETPHAKRRETIAA